MVAYYALLSLVPFLVMTVSLLSLEAGTVSANSYVIREFQHILPGQSVRDLEKPVESIQQNASTLGVIGLIGLFWTSLGFYSALESALNIVLQGAEPGVLSPEVGDLRAGRDLADRLLRVASDHHHRHRRRRSRASASI